MLVPLRWLKEHVPVEAEPEILAERLTMAGIEVSSVHRVKAPFQGVTVGEITRIQKHPNADRLIVCQVAAGPGRTYQIVTGDLSLREGAKVPMAPPGSTLPGGTVMKELELRGVRSQGMACCITELLLGEPHREGEGVFVFEEGKAKAGEDAAEVLGWDDWVLDLDPTPNYAHCLSIRGVATEVAAIFRLRLLPLALPQLPVSSEAGPFEVSIEDPELCPRYAGALAAEVRVGHSPPWLRWRLHIAGLRSLNDVVDITNYVMLELGQPLHAFDFEKLGGGRIVVRRARMGERLTTLDGVERDLDGQLAICDCSRPVAVAGVIGGEESAVSFRTKSVLFESAYFNPLAVRRSSRSLSLRTDASSRFERGIDPTGQVRALARVASMVEALGIGRVVGPVVDCRPLPIPARQIEFRPSRANQVLGLDLGPEEQRSILESLGLEVDASKSTWLVKVPPYRVDLEEEIDLTEELARIKGYENIPATLPRGRVTKGGKSAKKEMEDAVREILVACGLNEAITYSFIDPEIFDLLRVEEGDPWRRFIRIANPLRKEQSVMRTSLLPGLLQALSYNLSRGVRDVRLFEVGPVYIPKDGSDASFAGLPEERKMIAAVACGRARPRNWNTPSEEADFYYLKGILEEMASRLGKAGGQLAFRPHSHPALHPARQATVLFGGLEVGLIGEVHPRVLKDLGVRWRATAFEVDLDSLMRQWLGGPEKEGVTAVRSPGMDKRYKPLPKYPAVERDIAVLVPREVEAETLTRLILEEATELLEDLSLFDVYEGERIPEGKKSLAFSMRYRAPDRTLSDAEVDRIRARVVERIKRDVPGATLRE